MFSCYIDKIFRSEAYNKWSQFLTARYFISEDEARSLISAIYNVKSEG
jgi:hypothetical protein